MSNILITLLILGAAVAGIPVYVLNYKPRRKSKVKDIYAEGLDLMIRDGENLPIRILRISFKKTPII